jgi:hypothetical protein
MHRLANLRASFSDHEIRLLSKEEITKDRADRKWKIIQSENGCRNYHIDVRKGENYGRHPFIDVNAFY